MKISDPIGKVGIERLASCQRLARWIKKWRYICSLMLTSTICLKLTTSFVPNTKNQIPSCINPHTHKKETRETWQAWFIHNYILILTKNKIRCKTLKIKTHLLNLKSVAIWNVHQKTWHKWKAMMLLGYQRLCIHFVQNPSWQSLDIFKYLRKIATNTALKSTAQNEEKKGKRPLLSPITFTITVLALSHSLYNCTSCKIHPIDGLIYGRLIELSCQMHRIISGTSSY